MKSKLVLVILFVISCLVIFYRFPYLPKNLSLDEVQFAQLALSLKSHGYIPYSPLATGHATLYFYIILIFFQILGVTNFALRLPSAVFGVMNVVLFYFIMRHVLKSSFPKLTNYLLQANTFFISFIFITMRWYFHFARFAFEATFLLMIEFISILLLFKFIEKEKLKYAVLSGLFAGLAYNSYTPGRIFFLVPLFTLLITKIKLKPSAKKNLIIMASFIIPFVLTILPLTVYLRTHQDTRIYQQSYATNNELSPGERLGYFGQNTVSNLLMFHVKGDLNGRHNYPAKPIINPILGVMLIIGLIFTLKNIKNFYNQFFLVYFVVGLVPTLLTYPWENPNMLRMFTTIPAIVYCIGNSFLWLFQHRSEDVKLKLFKFTVTLSQTALLLIVTATLFFSAIYELRTYYKFHATIFDQAFEMRGPIDELVKKIPVR